jgi:hypothetical protein
MEESRVKRTSPRTSRFASPLQCSESEEKKRDDAKNRNKERRGPNLGGGGSDPTL